jgi:mono/diheme cytochrome c family protein
MKAKLVLPAGLAAVLAACAPTGEQLASPQNPDLVAVGSGLYQENCSQCHGADLRGTEQGPSLLSRVYEPSHHPDGAFLAAVMAGVRPHHWNFGPMPPIEGLNPDDIEAIVAFVRERQREEGFEPYPP